MVKTARVLDQPLTQATRSDVSIVRELIKEMWENATEIVAGTLARRRHRCELLGVDREPCARARHRYGSRGIGGDSRSGNDCQRERPVRVSRLSAAAVERRIGFYTVPRHRLDSPSPGSRRHIARFADVVRFFHSPRLHRTERAKRV